MDLKAQLTLSIADKVIASKEDSVKLIKIDEILRQQYELEADLLIKESDKLMIEMKLVQIL